MSKKESIYFSTAIYWMHRWKDALMAKDFVKAKDYFKKAHRWKRRANLDGILQEISEPLEQS